MKLTFKQKADIFFFGVIFLLHFFMVFHTFKKVSPAYKAGVLQSAKIMTRNMR